jgi:hypothetical protein
MKIEQRIPTKVRGTTFRTVDFGAIQAGDRLELYREYDTPHDRNAVQVVHDGSFIGYIGRDLAVQLAEIIDAGDSAYAKVSEVTGGTADAPNHGVNAVVIITQTIDERVFVGTAS